GVRSLPKVAPAWEPEKVSAIAAKVASKELRQKIARVAIGVLTVGISEAYRFIRGAAYTGIIRSLGGKRGSPLPDQPKSQDSQLHRFFSVIPDKNSPASIHQGPSLYHS